jgi:hypothetical protein
MTKSHLPDDAYAWTPEQIKGRVRLVTWTICWLSSIGVFARTPYQGCCHSRGCQIGYTDRNGCHQSVSLTRVEPLPGVLYWLHGPYTGCRQLNVF